MTPGASARAKFITAVYLHLFGAILAFIAFEVALFKSGLAAKIAAALSGVPWGLVLAAFLLIAWFATRMAWRLETRLGQYAGLGLYIVAKGLIFVPLLFRAERLAPGMIEQAAQVTALGALGLTLIAWASRSDFSFLRPFLYWGGTVALLLIVAAILFGWHLGTWFSIGMIALSGASIIYDTAGIARRYGRGSSRRTVGAALALFASIGMMFWYVLRLSTRLQRG
ncbi:MAG: Bax inhibitor-1 family protein [Deltaproteobacteria bacterium]|nr:Bax inhibitor-1 family protein [Deltaproteobacteria bacterium]